MKNSILLFLFVILTSVLASCEKDEPIEPSEPIKVATGSYHIFYVAPEQNLSNLELYNKSTMTLDSNVTLSSDSSYPGSVYLYDDTTYFLKVKDYDSYFYEGTFVLGDIITHTDSVGSLQKFTVGGIDKWRVNP